MWLTFSRLSELTPDLAESVPLDQRDCLFAITDTGKLIGISEEDLIEQMRDNTIDLGAGYAIPIIQPKESK